MPSFRRSLLKNRRLQLSGLRRTPGVYVEEVSSGLRPIAGVNTSIAAFIGWSAQGPTTHAVRVASFQGFEHHFGGLDKRSFLGYAVLQFFNNGGRDAWIVRLAGAEDEPLNPNEPAFESKLDPFNRKGGIYLLDAADPFNVLCVPGETNTAVVSALQAFCEDRRAFLLVDGPEGASPSSVQSAPAAMATGPGARNSALYYPWVMAADPLDGNRLRHFPPCGFVAGIIARTDSNRGVWKAPAGMQATIIGANGTQVVLNDGDIRMLNPLGINCIRVLSGSSTLLWGSRTLASANSQGSEWKYIPARRLGLFLEGSLERGLQWAAFENNDSQLWSRIRLNVENFLLSLYRQGAFQGSQPKQAYFVRCDATTTTAYDIQAGVVHLMVGFAPVRPSEFVILRISISQR